MHYILVIRLVNYPRANFVALVIKLSRTQSNILDGIADSVRLSTGGEVVSSRPHRVISLAYKNTYVALLSETFSIIRIWQITFAQYGDNVSDSNIGLWYQRPCLPIWTHYKATFLIWP